MVRHGRRTATLTIATPAKHLGRDLADRLSGRLVALDDLDRHRPKELVGSNHRMVQQAVGWDSRCVAHRVEPSHVIARQAAAGPP